MTYPKEIIVAVLHLFVEGLSLSKIRDFLWQHFGYRPSIHAMLSWVKEYSELIERFERKRKPRIKGRMHVDEVFVEIRGRRCYVIHMVDSRTGYCPEAVLSERRNLKAYGGFFARLKKRLGGQIRGIFEREREKPPKKRTLVRTEPRCSNDCGRDMQNARDELHGLREELLGSEIRGLSGG